MRWFPAALAAEFEQEPMKVVEIEGEMIVVCRVEGHFFAVEDRCSHDDGPLGEGDLEGHRIICPRHGAAFDIATGAALTMPAVTPIRSFPVKIEDSRVLVGIGD